MLNWFKKIFSRLDDSNFIKRGNKYLALGKLDKAEECYRQYIIRHPKEVEGYINIGYVLNEQKKFDQAEYYLLQAISLDSSQPDALYLLGLTYQKKMVTGKAVTYYQSAININPFMEEAYHQLYQIYLAGEESAESKAQLIKNAANNPDCALAQYYVGCVNLIEHNDDLALVFFDKAVVLEPNNATVYLQMGRVHQKKGEYILAAENYQKAISINSTLIDAYINLGLIFQKQRKYDDAIAIYQRAIEISGDNFELFNNLGFSFHCKNKFQLAISAYQKAIELNPTFGSAYGNLAMAFNVLHNYEEAIVNYQKAFQFGIKTQNIVSRIASAQHMQGKFDEAIETYRQALTMPADDAAVNMTHSNLLFTYTYCKYSQEQYLYEAKAYGYRVLSKAVPYQRWLNDMNVNSNRCLRVGLVSADLLGRHPVGCFIHSLLTKINKNRLEFVIYANGNKEDELSECIKSYAVAWHNINALSDEVAAKQIYDDCIDVLIDLSGHTGENRLALFAWKPAPVQVTWLGYWASTGVPGIDYLLADEVALPIEDHPYFSEKIHYLPNTRMCLESPRGGDEVDVSLLPAQRNGYVTFGSFQNAVKMNMSVLAVWRRLLDALPTAQLRLQSPLFVDPGVCEQLSQRLMLAGIDANRVTINLPQFYRDYLTAYSEIDIVLDTFPFPGGTTTCEALWMGVPTVTLAGDTMIARQGASMLTSAGLNDWVANTEEEYLNIAINKVRDLKKLAALRANLREQVRMSPLCNSELFARNFENAICEMWKEKICSFNIQG